LAEGALDSAAVWIDEPSNAEVEAHCPVSFLQDKLGKFDGLHAVGAFPSVSKPIVPAAIHASRNIAPGPFTRRGVMTIGEGPVAEIPEGAAAGLRATAEIPEGAAVVSRPQSQREREKE
jgi:hypothetical protein